MTETKARTLLRAVTYRITAVTMTIIWTYMFTGDIANSTWFSLALHALLSIDYYIHERVWLKINWGKK